VAKQLTGLEDLWNTKAKRQLRQGRELAEQASSADQVTAHGVRRAARMRAPGPRLSSDRKSLAMSAVMTDPSAPLPGANSAARPRCLGPLAGLAGAGAGLPCWSFAVPVGAGDLHRLCERNRALTLGHFSNFFQQTLLRESFSTA
jgi:hypothetical protein